MLVVDNAPRFLFQQTQRHDRRWRCGNELRDADPNPARASRIRLLGNPAARGSNRTSPGQTLGDWAWPWTLSVPGREQHSLLASRCRMRWFKRPKSRLSLSSRPVPVKRRFGPLCRAKRCRFGRVRGTSSPPPTCHCEQLHLRSARWPDGILRSRMGQWYLAAEIVAAVWLAKPKSGNSEYPGPWRLRRASWGWGTL